MYTPSFLQKTLLTPLLVIMAAAGAQAQNDTHTPPPMTPAMTEFWEPQPKVVTPGIVPSQPVAPPPSDAIVLFNGKDLSMWRNHDGGEAGWKVHDGIVTVEKSKGDIITKQDFNDFQLHIEWQVPADITGESQARGNSGIIIDEKYELQVLDSYKNRTYVNGQAASIYKQSPPLVNAMNKPGDWNIYDVLFTAPRFNSDSSLFSPAHITVLHNGVVVQNNTEIHGTTPYIGLPEYKMHGKGPILLQAHGDPSKPISYRNIWIRNLN